MFGFHFVAETSLIDFHVMFGISEDLFHTSLSLYIVPLLPSQHMAQLQSDRVPCSQGAARL